mmetsp:Transcript_35239/g.90056  ORF Transcript_35239/g.90056 Transcript_35239/m.90056 type:complete len:208 (-) Transcript_35239:101-724(-)
MFDRSSRWVLCATPTLLTNSSTQPPPCTTTSWGTLSKFSPSTCKSCSLVSREKSAGSFWTALPAMLSSSSPSSRTTVGGSCCSLLLLRRTILSSSIASISGKPSSALSATCSSRRLLSTVRPSGTTASPQSLIDKTSRPDTCSSDAGISPKGFPSRHSFRSCLRPVSTAGSRLMVLCAADKFMRWTSLLSTSGSSLIMLSSRTSACR